MTRWDVLNLPVEGVRLFVWHRMSLGVPCCRLSGATSPEKGSGVLCACLVEAFLLSLKRFAG